MLKALAAGFVAATLASSIVRAADITLIAPGGIRGALEELIPGFEKASGNHVKATFGSGGGTRQQVKNGEPFDAPVVQLPDADVVASGAVVAASRTPLARVWVGFAAKTGAPHPDISTADAVRKLLLGARAIAYPDASSGAAAGVSFNDTLKKMGLAETLAPKLKIVRGGSQAMAALAHDDVDVALTFVSEIIGEPGVEVVGPLPAAVSDPTRLVGYVSVKSTQPDATRALLAYLSSPAAAEIYKKRGMEPGE